MKGISVEKKMCANPTKNFQTCYPKHTYFLFGLIWIQTVWHWDGIPKRKLILKKIRRQKSMKNYPVLSRQS